MRHGTSDRPVAMSQANEALASHWRHQAAKFVTAARGSDNLRDMVRLVAAASVLESAARKVCMGSDVDLQKAAELARQVASVDGARL